MKIRTLMATLVIAAVGMGTPGSADRSAGADHDQQHPNLRLLHADVPMYPQLARVARVSGTVEMQVTINNGVVTNTEARTGPGILCDATSESIRSWRFAESINTTITTSFTYELDVDKPSYGQNPRVELELPFKVTIISTPVLGD